MSLAKDESLTVVVTGKADAVMRARRMVINELQTQVLEELPILFTVPLRAGLLHVQAPGNKFCDPGFTFLIKRPFIPSTNVHILKSVIAKKKGGPCQ